MWTVEKKRARDGTGLREEGAILAVLCHLRQHLKSGKALGKRMCGGRNQCKAMRWFECSKAVSLHLRKDRPSVTDPGSQTLQSTGVVKRPDEKLRQGFPGARAA